LDLVVVGNNLVERLDVVEDNIVENFQDKNPLDYVYVDRNLEGHKYLLLELVHQFVDKNCIQK
jgi:hypothetical protein